MRRREEAHSPKEGESMRRIVPYLPWYMPPYHTPGIHHLVYTPPPVYCPCTAHPLYTIRAEQLAGFNTFNQKVEGERHPAEKRRPLHPENKPSPSQKGRHNVQETRYRKHLCVRKPGIP